MFGHGKFGEAHSFGLRVPASILNTFEEFHSILSSMIMPHMATHDLQWFQE